MNHKNFAQTILAAPITDAAATSITVASSVTFPAAPFIISIDTEAMLVTVVAGTTWTVTRGYEGSTAATHTNGATIFHDISAAEADSIISGVTATAAELNKLEGVLATTAELNFVDGVTSALQPQLAAKAPLASPALTGTPTAPTAAVDTNTTQLATTAMVVAQAAAATPVVDGVAAVGTSKRYARADHKHPTDTSLVKGPVSSAKIEVGLAANGSSTSTPASSGTVTFPTAFVSTPAVIISAQGLSDVRYVIGGINVSSFTWAKYGTAGNWDAFWWLAVGN